MNIKKVAVSAALVAALAAKSEAKVKLTKQKAISLRLAQWLGYSRAATYPNPLLAGQTIVLIDPIVSWEQFDPFASTTEGRAQLAECVIKAVQTDLVMVAGKTGVSVGADYALHDRTPENIVAAALEAIYYAIGGVKGDWE